MYSVCLDLAKMHYVAGICLLIRAEGGRPS